MPHTSKPVLLAAAFLVLFVLSCQHKNFPNPNALQIGQWIVSGRLSPADSALLTGLPCALFDSLAAEAAAKKSLGYGAFADTLADENGTEYVVGYKTPKKFRGDTLYPLIIYLHGGTGTLLNSKGALAYDMLSPLGDTFDLFLASPSANRDAPWWSSTGLARILQTLRYMSVRYPINPDKVFLAGVSDGATGCFAAANTIPGPFAGFFAVSGFGGMLPQVGMQLFPVNLQGRPIYDVNAGQDRIYSLPMVVSFLDELQSSGVPVERSLYPDELHGFDYRAREFGHFAGRIRLWSKPRQAAGFSRTFIPGFPAAIDYVLDWRPQKNLTRYPWVQVRINGDTLFMASDGIREISIVLKGNDIKSLTVIANDGKKLSVAKRPISSPERLHLIQQAGFVSASQKYVFKIKP
ncbi:MAG: hypothetical protein PHC61_18920 [Chitinivibrionales bacterium]|nr:hypothetical protein [Chitinivibrionales bacterium]